MYMFYGVLYTRKYSYSFDHGELNSTVLCCIFEDNKLSKRLPLVWFYIQKLFDNTRLSYQIFWITGGGHNVVDFEKLHFYSHGLTHSL